MVKRYPFSDPSGLYMLSGADICTAEFVVDAVDYDALAAELAQWKNDNLEIAGKFTKANYRIRDLEAALAEVKLQRDSWRRIAESGLGITAETGVAKDGR